MGGIFTGHLHESHVWIPLEQQLHIGCMMWRRVYGSSGWDGGCIAVRGGRANPSVDAAWKTLKKLAASDSLPHKEGALYGLKQEGRAWQNRWEKEVRALGATPTKGGV